MENQFREINIKAQFNSSRGSRQKSHLAKSIAKNVYNRLNIELFRLLFGGFKPLEPPRIGFESFKPTAFGKTSPKATKTDSKHSKLSRN